MSELQEIRASLSKLTESIELFRKEQNTKNEQIDAALVEIAKSKTASGLAETGLPAEEETVKPVKRQETGVPPKKKERRRKRAAFLYSLPISSGSMRCCGTQ